jgi:ParB/RepB/Spo0J family partition protein
MTPTTTRARKPATPTTPDVPPDALVMAPTTNGADAPPVVDQTYAMVPIGAIKPNPDNPRSGLGSIEAMEQLIASIRALGIQEPLLVEWSAPSEPYVLLAGHRRLHAAEQAGLTEVPCMVRRTATSAALRMEIALVENLQREGLAPLDEANGYAELVKLGLSQRQIAERVGCSQPHVSNRIALLGLPSPVRARIAKGTLPLEAARALVRLRDHPDKLKAAAGADPSMIGQEVERAEKVIAWEAKRDELVAVAKGRGWPVVDEPSWSAKRSFKTLSHWNGPPELDVPIAKHEAEPCHAVMIPGDPPQWYSIGVPHATSVCTDPARHGPKGASELKAKVPRQTKRQPAEWEVKEAQDRKDRKDRKAASEARAAVLAAALAAYKPPARPSIELTITLRASVGRMMGWDVAQLAGELLALDPPEKGSNWYPVVEAFAAQGAAQLHRAALALAFASGELGLRGHYGRFGEDVVAEHYAYLATLGYQPSPWEQGKLDEAAKAAAGEDDD